MNKEIRAVLEGAEAQGWRVEPTKKGWLLYPPDLATGPVSVHGTPSDRRVFQNMVAEMRRRGFRWPP